MSGSVLLCLASDYSTLADVSSFTVSVLVILIVIVLCSSRSLLVGLLFGDSTVTRGSLDGVLILL